MRHWINLVVKSVYPKRPFNFLDRLNDGDLLPSIGLGALAGLISWKSNKTAPLPIKAIYTIGGVFVSTLITHRKFRENLKSKASSILPDALKLHLNIVDERIGMFGADIWNRSEEIFNQLKERLNKNK